jgi:hypothetical protein
MRKNKAFYILFMLLAFHAVAFSQVTTNSPYSKYGIGVLRPSVFGTNFAMGGTGIGLRSNRDIGFLNPASYSAIGVTSFDIGFNHASLWLDDGTQTQYQNNPYISHLVFGFPVVKNTWGMSFGVMPFSNTGYAYDNIINDPIAGDVSFYNEASGAINKVYWGNGLAAKIDSTSNVSIGFNAYFLFGAMNYDQKAIYGDLPSAFNVWKIRDVTVSDFGADFGLQYKKTFSNQENEKVTLVLGATYGLAADLSGKRTELIRTFTGNIQFGQIKDTVDFIDNVDHVTQLPSEMGFGFSLEKERKWLIAADYKTSDWGAIATNDAIYSYQSSYKVALGGQIIPRYDGSKYVQRIAYRFGTRYSTSYLSINNTDWTEYGITFGIGLPIRRAESTYPRLNLGIEYGNRGTTDQGLIKEKFVNFNVGVTINAVWFQKRKYD